MQRFRKRKSDAVEMLQQRYRKCKMLLVQAMHDSQLELVQGKKSAAEMWQAIAERHKRESVSSRAVLSREYHGLKYKPGDVSFGDFCLKFDRIVRELRNMGSAMEDLDVFLEFMWTLPSEYGSLVTALQTVEESHLPISCVRRRVEDSRAMNKKGGPSRPATRCKGSWFV